jgi:HD-GYP domain-containing protein (c-di-GMP phosphodiesterase class II)
MRQHPSTGMHMLSQIDSLSAAVPAITHHHERFDGSGYPDGLAGEEIPLASRVLMVTDAFDAMTSDRPYRKAMPVEQALRELQANAGTQFDPRIVEAFVKMIGRHGIHPSHAASNGHAEMPRTSIVAEAPHDEPTGTGSRQPDHGQA